MDFRIPFSGFWISLLSIRGLVSSSGFRNSLFGFQILLFGSGVTSSWIPDLTISLGFRTPLSGLRIPLSAFLITLSWIWDSTLWISNHTLLDFGPHSLHFQSPPLGFLITLPGFRVHVMEQDFYLFIYFILLKTYIYTIMIHRQTGKHYYLLDSSESNMAKHYIETSILNETETESNIEVHT